MTTDKPMIVRMHYNDLSLTGDDPHTLAIFAWNAFNRQWEKVGGRLSTSQGYLSAAVSRFTTYALVSEPAWHDEFSDESGIASTTNVRRTSSGLALSSAPGSGEIVSHLVAPQGTLTGWGVLSFTATAAQPATALSVDVLSVDGIPLLTNVASGTSLATLDPVRYPQLILRARLSSEVAGTSPLLHTWGISWNVQPDGIFLPFVMASS